jgi:hypothetical protein
MKTWPPILRYGLLLGGLILILPHMLLRYGVLTDSFLVTTLHFPYDWAVGLLLCAIGFGWPNKKHHISSGTGDGIGWTSGGDSADGGGGGGD